MKYQLKYIKSFKSHKAPNFKNLILIVNDSYFGAEKAKILLNVISGSGMKGFTFINNADSLDYDNH